MAKLSGEITNVVASIGSLESSLIRLESTQKSLVRSLDDMQRQIGQRATVDDLRTLRTQVATCAAKEDLARVEEQVGQCARRQELDDVLSTMQAGFTNKKTDQQLSVLKESFSAQIGIVQQSMVKLASKAEVAEVQRATGEAAKSAKGADEAVNDLKRSLEELAQRFSAMDASLDERHKGEDENVQRVDAEAFSEITTRITAAESTCSRLADQVDAVSDSVSLNTRTMRTQATMLQEVTEEVNKKLSTEDWEQIESEIDRVYATKEQVAESVEPIVTKLNQVVAKLIDLDKDIAAKADGQTVVENREHIQDLFRVIHDQVSRLGATDAAPSGTSASAADAGSAMTATKESSVPLPAAAAAAALAARMPEAVSSPMPKSLENADASQKGSTKMKALQQEMKNQAKEIQNIRKALATTKHADATNTSASAALESQFAERLDAQEKDLLQLRASIEELRNIFTLSGDTAREQMALAERPVITTVRTELGEVPRMPSRPEGSAPLTAPSPRAQSINSTSSDKKLEVSP
ncbi:Hypothetical Protein FCC1311_105282 [Hondaea fermentalgiana]|uniref:Uncharacterized protein n=1 Tax=Hondaea fermentalgiana TaxID=2315210 RepID=A0A2R5GUQ9_9STRA|nr:Hypothetical Protein FCC1311_105282 [Hondaea fermentalgiana]|eukprot:GBG34305.1 Hypothetical Protein FCC1311_105282 [Hondaea fermentalgiana]